MPTHQPVRFGCREDQVQPIEHQRCGVGLTVWDGCSRRTAQRAVKRAHELLVADLEDVDRKHVVAQLEYALFAADSKALEDGQPAVIVGVSCELRALLQLNGVGHNRPSFRLPSF